MKKIVMAGLLLTAGFTRVFAEENAAASQGCTVERVQAGSPAEAAGLQTDDVIIEADSATIRSADDLQKAVRKAGVDLSIVVRRGNSTTTLVAHLQSEKAKGYRLGTLCAEDASHLRSLASFPSGSAASVYIGPAFSMLSLKGDFDGNHVLINSETGAIAVVPKFDNAFGYGGVLGIRSRVPAVGAIDLALELSYQQGSMDNSFEGISNDKQALLHDFGFTTKGYFLTDGSLQPVIGIGMDIPWLTVPEAAISPTAGIIDETYHGIGFHTGAGLYYSLGSQISVEAFLAYYWRRFDTLNSSSIDHALISNTFEPSISIRYHFSFGKQAEKNGLLPPKV